MPILKISVISPSYLSLSYSFTEYKQSLKAFTENKVKEIFFMTDESYKILS